MSEQMTVVAKLVKATQELGTFAADKHNPQGRYDYISADQVLGRIGKVLAANGVMVIPAITRTEHLEGQTGKGTKSYVCNIEFCMKITDGDGAVDMFWAGSGVDYGSPDKALYKAITSGHKYFLMKLFNVGIGNEDGEHEAADQSQAQQRPQPTRQTQRPPQTPTQHRNGAKQAPQEAPQQATDLPSLSADEAFGDMARRGDIQPETLERLNELGIAYYGDDWSDKLAQLCEHASGGEANSALDLYDSEAQVLIRGLEKRVGQKEQAAA